MSTTLPNPQPPTPNPASEASLDLLREVSHRLRTPLATIHGYASLLEVHVVDQRVDPAALAEWARRIQVETERLSGLLADLSRLRGLANGGLRSAALDLQALTGEAVREAQSELDQPIELAAGPPVPYTGDASLLRRAIYHVLVFARQRRQQAQVRVSGDDRGARVEVALAGGWTPPVHDAWWLFCNEVVAAHAGRLEASPSAVVLVLG